jgi:hypothetical protein
MFFQASTKKGYHIYLVLQPTSSQLHLGRNHTVTFENQPAEASCDLEDVAIKVELDEEQETENIAMAEEGIDIEEHSVKLEDEEEQNDTLICGLPAPDTTDHEQPQDIGMPTT